VITRDFFLRMIQQLAQVIAKVLKLGSVQQYDAAMEEIQRSSRQLLGMDVLLLTTLSDEEYVRLFTLGNRFDVEKCVVAGELLRLVGDVKSQQGEAGKAFQCYTTSLSLFLELLIRESGVLPKEYFDEIELLIEKATPYEIPVGVQKKLFRYYETVGRFDKAENFLFEILEQENEIAAEGIRFYERLRVKKDEELERGNLPRQEVEAGMYELQIRTKQR